MKAPAIALLLLIIAAPAWCQTQPTGVVTPPAHFLAECSAGAEDAYRTPYFDCGGRAEIPFTYQFELQALGSFSPSTTKASGDGKTLDLIARPILWAPGGLFGGTADVGYEQLWSPLRNNGRFIFAPGLVFRGAPLGVAQRLWIKVLIPTGAIDKATLVEGDRATGPELLWEIKAAKHFRVEIAGAIYRAESQGNPACDGSFSVHDTCPRARYRSGSATIGFAWDILDKSARSEAW